jgi:hypothetical protein
MKRANIALIFIKPHANNEAVREFVSSEIANKGLTLLCEGEKSAEDIESSGAIDAHYASIATAAMETKAADLVISDEKKAEFKTKFGSTWESALDLGLINNSKEAAEKLGNISGGDLNQAWQKNSSMRLKLAPGLYIENLNEDEPMYVINGFYMAMRDKYVEGPGIYYYVVGFDANVTDWAKFRGELIGSTDPTTAPPASIRGKMLTQWEDLGLHQAPDVGDNGVHASAGPIEGLKERTVWLGYPAEEDPFGELLLKWVGGDVAKIKPWLDNAPVDEPKNYGIKGNMFDLTEDKDSAWALAFCNNLAMA